MSAAPPGDLRTRYRAARIVGTALLAAVGVHAVVVALALAETPAVFGILVFVTTGQRGAAYALFLLSLAGLALYFPRWSQWEEWARDVSSISR